MTSAYGVFAQYYDALTKNVCYAERAAKLDALIRKWETPDSPDNILLDLACGTGSLSEEFARLGWDVIGVDGSEEMLNEALDKKIRKRSANSISKAGYAQTRSLWKHQRDSLCAR